MSGIVPEDGSLAAARRYQSCVPSHSQGAAAADSCLRRVTRCCRLRRRRPSSPPVSSAVPPESHHPRALLAPCHAPLPSAWPGSVISRAGCDLGPHFASLSTPLPRLLRPALGGVPPRPLPRALVSAPLVCCIAPGSLHGQPGFFCALDQCEPCCRDWRCTCDAVVTIVGGRTAGCGEIVFA